MLLIPRLREAYFLSLLTLASSGGMECFGSLLHISEGGYGVFMLRMCPMLLHEILDICESILVIFMIEKKL